MDRDPLNLDQNPVVIDPDDVDGALKDEPTTPADEDDQHAEMPRPPAVQDPGR